MKPTPEQQVWLDEQMAAQTASPLMLNPCVRLYGAGPEGEICKHCALLERRQFSKTYLKCSLRRNTRGPATDHKAGWSACAKFTKAS